MFYIHYYDNSPPSPLPLLRLYVLCLIIEILIGFKENKTSESTVQFIVTTPAYVWCFLLIFEAAVNYWIFIFFFSFCVEGPLEGSTLSIPSNNKDIWTSPSEGFCIQLFASSLQIWFYGVNGKHTSVILCTDSNLIKIKSYWFFLLAVLKDHCNLGFTLLLAEHLPVSTFFTFPGAPFIKCYLNVYRWLDLLKWGKIYNTFLLFNFS